ncbi:MAG TPA: ElyC/SanA/YdcF family protein [Vicinamibacterales bacterium]|nr:ElyC/SanA/YdcF family protein [Vicinamibacterales bacterium]
MTSRPSDVLCISSIDWDFIWQGHQEIMSTLAAKGHRVLFVENTGVRPPRVGDLPRVRQRIRNWWRGTKGFRQERPNLFVYSPLVLPLPYSRIARWINSWILLRALLRWMKATGFYRPIVWTFLPTPLALDLIRGVDPQVTIYYCIDDLASSSPAARRISHSEAALFRQADLVFVTSEKLRRRAAEHGARVHLFPFGVSFERFDAVRSTPDAVPEDIRSLARPIVGYIGGLHQWVDQDLVARVAAKTPEATFALVGPAQTDVSALGRCPNVRLLGQRPHADVPRYVKGFDIGIVPYRLTEYTANVYPTKLNEYLVMGIPVVATDLPEIQRFNAEHGDLVQVARDPDAFSAAIRDCLARANPAEISRRIAAAHSNSWEQRLATMETLIDDAIERRRMSEQRWDVTLRRVYRKTRSRLIPSFVALLLAYTAVFETNLMWRIAAPLRVIQPPQQADAIVIFGGGVGETGRAGGGALERLKQGVDLYNAGYARTMIISSGYVYTLHEAEVMRATAIDQGIPASAIVLEQRASNTYQNVRFVSDILHERRSSRILLVSSPYHMKRALLVWSRVAPDIAVVPTPPSDSQFYEHQRGASLEQVRAILQEYVAIGAYWRRGWV